MRLNVSMDNLASVHIFKSHAYLYKPLENLHFTKRFTLLLFLFDMISQVTNFAVFHDDDQLGWCQKTFLVFHNIGMFEIFEQIDLQHTVDMLFLF